MTLLNRREPDADRLSRVAGAGWNTMNTKYDVLHVALALALAAAIATHARDTDEALAETAERLTGTPGGR